MALLCRGAQLQLELDYEGLNSVCITLILCYVRCLPNESILKIFFPSTTCDDDEVVIDFAQNSKMSLGNGNTDMRILNRDM